MVNVKEVGVILNNGESYAIPCGSKAYSVLPQDDGATYDRAGSGQTLTNIARPYGSPQSFALFSEGDEQIIITARGGQVYVLVYR